MGWGDCLSLSEIGYEHFPALPEMLGQALRKPKTKGQRGTWGRGWALSLTPYFPQVTSAVEALLSADSASRKQEVQAWDGEVRQVSKHAFNLKQLDNPARIPPW